MTPRRASRPRRRTVAQLQRERQAIAEEATRQVLALLDRCALTPDQLIRVAKEFDAMPTKVQVDGTLAVRFA